MPSRRQNTVLDLASQGFGSHAQVGITGRLLANSQTDTSTVLFPTTVLSSTYVASDPIKVYTFTKVHLLVEITVTTAADIASIVPEVCAHEDGQSFYPLSDLAATVVLNLPNAPGTYNKNEFASKIARPLEIRNDTVATDADIISMWVTVDVPFGYMFRVKCAAAAGTPTLKVTAALST